MALRIAVQGLNGLTCVALLVLCVLGLVAYVRLWRPGSVDQMVDRALSDGRYQSQPVRRIDEPDEENLGRIL